ncbi:alpha-D-ribose 1-methylphosphonate 5-triphosphate synthase subunit PhnL [Arboricoccus pini]|uniref:Alpha-D-ribose 1-methylphosphonate 5-triphosphate synthase subunit PhnL n=1 Tax=Arboricoccus pini TaxID=1963835 RepID=A0A212R210_9PROT|nr:phosphonate C-P lyase system protein PhnL [Arboricoccus pini]SNB66017.1 alpha-D-ribose 1-methylphosphonate 5-triphosphate synthase subunit PhnL [Arboricoccus pini]
MSKKSVLTFVDVGKAFTLHLQGSADLPVVSGVTFDLHEGECVALGGPSGIGKSSLLKMAYGNYRCSEGHILFHAEAAIVDIPHASPHAMLALRRKNIGYVSQFLRVIPRVPTLQIVEAAGVEGGLDESAAKNRARDLLSRLNVPDRLWSLPPATFSGGEQQRVNIARGLCAERRLLLLDEPTASLDAANGAVVVDIVKDMKRRGTAVLGIFHDDAVRTSLVDRVIDMRRYAGAGTSEASAA